MLAWKIYYGDGTTFSSEDELLEDPPGRNVQVIAEADDSVGTKLLQGKDYYLRCSGRWIGVDLVGLIDQLVEQGIVKVGQQLTDDEYQAIYQRALADRELARKSAWKPDERRA